MISLSKKPSDWLPLLLILFVIFSLTSCVGCYINSARRYSSEAPTPSTETPANLYEQLYELAEPTKESPIGYLSYQLISYATTKAVGHGVTRDKADAVYLIIKLKAINISTQPLAIPTPFLIDEQGNRYESKYVYSVPDQFHRYDKLNPSVSRIGHIAFDVPMDRKYYLVLSGDDQGTTMMKALLDKPQRF